jgi:hypothetical protein
MRGPRRLVAFLIAGGVAASLSGCTPGGDGYAADLAERIIIGIGDDITPPYPKPREADFLAAEAIDNPRLPSHSSDVDYLVEAMSWEGNSGDESGARIQFRISVHVSASRPVHIGDLGTKEGQSTRCWELTVFGLHDYDSLKQREIACTDDSAPPHPTAAPIPDLPADVEAVLAATLQGATVEDVDQRVRTRFPDDFYSVESKSLNGELAVALGIPAELKCVVGVVHADGSVEVLRGFKTVLLQPGEGGCSPDLYFFPVSTH